MNKSEFESRVFANPSELDQETTHFANSSPEYKQLLEDAQKFDRRLQTGLLEIPIPQNLAARLKSAVTNIPETKISTVPTWRNVRAFALAASLALALAVTFSVLVDPAGPSAEELAFGQNFLRHVHLETEGLDTPADLNLQGVNAVMSVVGGQLRVNDSTRSLRVSFAKPCFVAGQSRSAHFVIIGEQGNIDIFVLDNSPVGGEFPVSDDRYNATVIPMTRGNLVLVGEKSESLNRVRELVAENIEWSI